MKAAGFALFEKSVKVMLGLAGPSRIQPPLILDDQNLLSTLVVKVHNIAKIHIASLKPGSSSGRIIQTDNRICLLAYQLLDFLEGHTAPFFLQAVKLIWELQKSSQFRHVETIFSSRLTSEDPRVRVSAFEAFGNLWRHTGNHYTPFTVCWFYV
jgi:hypothetical protein